MNRYARTLLLFVAVAISASGMGMLACVDGLLPNAEPCPQEIPLAQNNVAGTYRYAGNALTLLRGTITFEHEGNLVRVVNTTYDNNADNRALISQPTPLQGNKLVTVLTPQNGDTDFRADVTFVFTEEGNRFCVAFSDTNGDAGELGTYTGIRP